MRCGRPITTWRDQMKRSPWSSRQKRRARRRSQNQARRVDHGRGACRRQPFGRRTAPSGRDTKARRFGRWPNTRAEPGSPYQPARRLGLTAASWQGWPRWAWSSTERTSQPRSLATTRSATLKWVTDATTPAGVVDRLTAAQRRRLRAALLHGVLAKDRGLPRLPRQRERSGGERWCSCLKLP